MITNTHNALYMQAIKKNKLDREFSWIKREFRDFHTLEDIELYNVEKYAALHLGCQF